MIRVLLIITFALASTVLGSLVGLYQGMANGILCGLIAFLGMLQIDAAITQRRFRKTNHVQISNLKRTNATFEKALAETRAKMEDVTKAVEARASAQGKKIVSELQVLESLMREFAGRISQKAKDEATDDKHIGRRARDTAQTYLDGLGEPELLETIRASLEEGMSLKAAYAALDDPLYPPASFDWQGMSEARIRATVAPGQAISVQTSYERGWEAWANGQRQPVRGDALGQLVIDPACQGKHCSQTAFFQISMLRRSLMISPDFTTKSMNLE